MSQKQKLTPAQKKELVEQKKAYVIWQKQMEKRCKEQEINKVSLYAIVIKGGAVLEPQTTQEHQMLQGGQWPFKVDIFVGHNREKADSFIIISKSLNEAQLFPSKETAEQYIKFLKTIDTYKDNEIVLKTVEVK